MDNSDSTLTAPAAVECPATAVAETFLSDIPFAGFASFDSALSGSVLHAPVPIEPFSGSDLPARGDFPGRDFSPLDNPGAGAASKAAVARRPVDTAAAGAFKSA